MSRKARWAAAPHLRDVGLCAHFDDDLLQVVCHLSLRVPAHVLRALADLFVCGRARVASEPKGRVGEGRASRWGQRRRAAHTSGPCLAA
jgi:hypothetical protein